MNRILFFLLFFCSAGVLISQPASICPDAPETRDHKYLSRYEGACIIGYDFKEFDAFTLPLGKVVRPGTEFKAEKDLNLEGRLTRIIYAVPENRTPLEVKRNYETALKNAGYEIMYTCSEDGCSNSNYLGLSYLYPLEKRLKTKGTLTQYALGGAAGQQYIAAKGNKDGVEVYISLYIATNNGVVREIKGRTVVLQDVIEVTPMDEGLVNAQAVAKGLAENGKVALYGILFDFGKAEVKEESLPALQEVAAFLKSNPAQKVFIVGHTDNVGQVASNLDLSTRRAEAVVNVLTGRLGVNPAQLSGYGVGPLAPVAANLTDAGRSQNRRVEIVAQ
ncbi:MAG: DUF4892 domain-containing protein [Bacteroidia bacterium]